MLDSAIKAGIPLIAASTSDLLNLKEVLNYLTDGNVARYVEAATPEKQTFFQGTVYYAVSGDKVTITETLFNKLANSQCVLVLINQDETSPYVFDAGEVPVPQELHLKYLKMVVEKDVAPFMRAASGLTIKQLIEVIKLCQVEYGCLTPDTMMRVRSSLMGKVAGLQQVDTTLKNYMVEPAVKTWLDNNRLYFLQGTDDRLAPRGALFNGVAGVGKSQAAKYIANELGVPLYRFDLSSSLSKYIGVSEANLSRMLAVIDQEAPCVLLLDEIEKIFSNAAGDADGGVTRRLLGQLLWWLQEHTSRVLTVMTTNDMDALPKELYRPGRVDVDAVFTLKALKQEEAFALAASTLTSFGLNTSAKLAVIEASLLDKLDKDTKTVSHAAVVNMVYGVIKARQWASPC